MINPNDNTVPVQFGTTSDDEHKAAVPKRSKDREAQIMEDLEASIPLTNDILKAITEVVNRHIQDEGVTERELVLVLANIVGTFIGSTFPPEKYDTALSAIKNGAIAFMLFGPQITGAELKVSSKPLHEEK